MLDRLVTDLIENTRARIASAGVKSVEDVRANPQRLAAFSDAVERQRAQAKAFLYEALYYSPDLKPEKEHADRVISELFAHWMQKPEDLPRSYQEKARQEPLARVVCDYIAGMTDNFILEQHRRVTG